MGEVKDVIATFPIRCMLASSFLNFENIRIKVIFKYFYLFIFFLKLKTFEFVIVGLPTFVIIKVS